MKFRKKPVVIEAVRFVGGRASAEELLRFCDGPPAERIGPITCTWHTNQDVLSILTLEGSMTASPGDWIIRGIKGEFYPVKDDIFRATYEEVDDAAL